MRTDLGLLPVPVGHFAMGDSESDANEVPRAATVKPLRAMRHVVTNRQFDATTGLDHEQSSSARFGTSRAGRITVVIEADAGVFV